MKALAPRLLRKPRALQASRHEWKSLQGKLRLWGGRDAGPRQACLRAYCHCQDCRGVLDIPFSAITAWDSEKVIIRRGADHLLEYKYPGKSMARYSCRTCGESLFNTSKYNSRLVSRTLVRKCNSNPLPREPESDRHFYYEERVIDINDRLPKYLQGVDGPLLEE